MGGLGMNCFLVIPCYRESERVPDFLLALCAAIEASGLSVGVQLVDDGSGPEEVRQLRRVVAKCRDSYAFVSEVFALDRNRGKGAAIRMGWALAPEGTRLLGFVDADGAVSAAETLRVLRMALADPQTGLVVASRRAKGARASRSLLRKAVAAGFAGLVRIFYGVQVLDTQCGCKFIAAARYESFAREMVEEGFGLDLELIVRARASGCPLKEIGVAWHEVPGSKVGVSTLWTLGKAVVLRRIGA